MTPEEAIRKLSELNVPDGDNEGIHLLADGILVKFIRENGYPEVAEAWLDLREDVEFWYV